MHRAKLPRLFQPFRCNDLVRLGKNHDGGYLINRQDIAKTQHLLSFGIGTDTSFEQDFVDVNPCAVDAWDASVDATDFFVGNRTHHKQNVSSKNLPVQGSNIFLKCDIEGGEYSILDQLIIRCKDFVGMAFEFHDINKPGNFDAVVNFVSKVDQKLVHLHVNNYFYYKDGSQAIPDILELTFSSGSNIIYDPKLTLPHALDMPNNPQDQEFHIVFE